MGCLLGKCLCPLAVQTFLLTQGLGLYRAGQLPIQLIFATVILIGLYCPPLSPTQHQIWSDIRKGKGRNWVKLCQASRFRSRSVLTAGGGGQRGVLVSDE